MTKNLAKYLKNGNRQFEEDFAVVLSKYQYKQIHFISIDEKHINYITIVEQGKQHKKCFTPKSRLKFFDIIEIKPSISIRDIEEYIDQEIKLFPIQTSDDIDFIEQYLISVIESDKMIDYIKNKRNKLKDQINELLNKINYQSENSDSLRIMQEEKDCFQLSLNFTFDSQQQEKIKQNISENEVTRYLTCVQNFDEDSLINHDLGLFGKWQIENENYTPITRQFKFGDKVLRITNVNRNRQFEKTLGVDLIYYHEYFSCLIMVQYKKWADQNNNYFYRADSQYEEDIKRMRESEEKIKLTKTNLTDKFEDKYESQRLTDNPFYFKICMPQQDTYSRTLVDGVYVNYQYLDYLMNTRRGIKGGKIVYKKDLPNPISNTLFIDLVKHGLIGCKYINEEQLNIIVNQLLEQGKSITLAETLFNKKQQLSIPNLY